MVSSDPPELRAAAETARRLASALDAIDVHLETLGEAAPPDAVAAALGEPIKAFGALAREVLR